MMRIAVTRPEGKGQQLIELLTQAGVASVHTPVLRIEACALSAHELAPIAEADILVFISQDAVKHLATQLDKLPQTAQVFAVGEQTAKVLQSHFGVKATSPKQQDSEGLLALPQLQDISDKQLVIVKGRGGRALLASTFKQRGAIVNLCAVYERLSEKAYSDNWLDHWRAQQIDGIVLTSNAAIDAIFNAQNKELLDWLKAKCFYLVSDRSADYLQTTYDVDRQHIKVAKGPGDLAIFNSIVPNQEQQGSHMSEQNTQSQDVAAPASSDKPIFKQKVSKLAILAFLVALAGGAATTGLIIHGQQISDKTYAALAELKAQNAQLQEQINQSQQQVVAMQAADSQKMREIETRLAAQSQTVEAQLQSALSQAKQQVSGALSSEAQYLQRMAEFKAHAERDFAGAIAVLQRFYQVVQNESNNTQLLSAIATDIATLQAQPKPALEATYLQINGMLNQVSDLALLGVQIPKPKANPDYALSHDIGDWLGNIERSWQHFKATFLTVKFKDAPVIEPLLDGQHQQLLRAQLRSYLSQAQTALVDKQASIFFTALKGATDTLEQYYDQNDSAVQAMQAQLEALQQMPLQFHSKVELVSGGALKEWLQ